MARVVVVKTNPYWPFSALNRAPYYLAIRAFIQLCKGFPEIENVYLRHGLLREDWVPAISDIDLTVLIDHKLSVEEELAFLCCFWKRYDALKKLFPMLTDINVLNSEHVRSCTKFTILGYESTGWRLVYGAGAIEGNYVTSSARIAEDSLNHSLLCYLNLFLKRFYKQEQPTCLVSQEMQRLTSKILRYANHFEPDSCNAEFDHRARDKGDMLYSTIKELEKRMKHSPPSANSSSIENVGEWLIDLNSRDIFLKDQTLDLKSLAPFREAIESIYYSYRRNIIVLSDGLDARTIKRCAEIAVQIFQLRKPAIVSRSIFKYMVRSYDPFLYTHLALCRKVAQGKDLLPDIQPPEMRFFIKRVLEQTVNVLTFPQSHDLIFPPGPDWFAGPVLDSIVERALFIKLYLENRVIQPRHRELVAECREYYPQPYKILRELRDSAGCASTSSLSEKAFRLLKSLANDIHNCLTISRRDEELFQADEGENDIGDFNAMTRGNPIIAEVEKGAL